jgi:hypothetical protein
MDLYTSDELAVPGRVRTVGIENGTSSKMKSQQWTHFSLNVESEQLWRVTFDNPPINLVTPEMLVELPELIDQMQAASELRVVVFESANPPSAGSLPRWPPDAIKRATTRCASVTTWAGASAQTPDGALTRAFAIALPTPG